MNVQQAFPDGKTARDIQTMNLLTGTGGNANFVTMMTCGQGKYGPTLFEGTGLQSFEAKRPVFLVLFGPFIKPYLGH